MARGKHSTALFEVINSGKKAPTGLKSASGKPFETKAAAASLLRTPKWWFKGSPKQDKTPDAAPAPAVVSNDPTANMTAATLTGQRSPIAPSAASTSARVIASPVAPAREPEVIVRDYSEPEPILAEQSFHSEPEEDRSTGSTSSPQAGAGRAYSTGSTSSPQAGSWQPEPEPAPSSGPIVKTWTLISRRREAAPSRSAVHFGVDRDRQEITLRMRYTTAIVSSFVVLVAVASAYVIGRHIGEAASTGGSTAMAPNGSTKVLRNGPAQPGVLDVGRGAHLAAAKIDGSAAPGSRTPDPDAFEDAPISSAGIADRTTNRNYLIIATFPPEKSDTAIKACDFLCTHGITCTLERDVHGEPLHWLSVVGTRGFPHKFKDNKDYLVYHDAIVALNDKFPSKSSFGRFNPMPYRWDGN